MTSEIVFVGEPEQGSTRPFSRAARAGGLIFVSGHAAPHEPDMGIFRGKTAGEQVNQSLAFIRQILEAEGSGLDCVVQVTMLITDPEDYAECNTAYAKHFPNGLPARHTARFGVPTDAKVAFACIAIAGNTEK